MFVITYITSSEGSVRLEGGRTRFPNGVGAVGLLSGARCMPQLSLISDLYDSETVAEALREFSCSLSGIKEVFPMVKEAFVTDTVDVDAEWLPLVFARTPDVGCRRAAG